MVKLSELVAKPVITLRGGTSIGTLENVVLDSNLSAVKYLIVFDEDVEFKRIVPRSMVISVAGDAVMVRDIPPQPVNLVIENCPLQASVFTESGEAEGTVSDIVLSGSLEVLYLVKGAEQTKLPLDCVVSFSKDALIVCYDPQKIQSIRRIKPKKPAPPPPCCTARDTDVAGEKACCTDADGAEGCGCGTLPCGCETAQQGAKECACQDDNAPCGQACPPDSAHGDAFETAEPLCNCDPPRVIVPPFTYLIGRRATENIRNQKDEIIVKKSAVISLAHIDACRRFGRLLHLARNNKEITTAAR